MSSCSVCQRLTEETYTTNVAWARAIGVSEASIRRHLEHGPTQVRPGADDDDDEPVSRARMELTSKGGEFFDIVTDKPLDDWSDVFRMFNRDPASFVITDDSVSMKMWMQSKRLDNGDRDTIQLYSYGAKFTRKAVDALDLKDLIASVRSWKPAKPVKTSPTPSTTMFIGLADWQLGKGEGDGTPGTKQRILDSLERTVERITSLRKTGTNVDSVLIANMGDHTEAVTGHYTNQTYTVDLNQRDQLNLAIELNLTVIKALAPLVESATYAACLCNHGQWQRVAGKALTDDSDNSTGFIADTLKTVCSLHPQLERMSWLIPRDEMITTGNFSGVNVAMAHGHKIGGAEETWLAKQSGWLHSERDFRPQLWATAHRHTAALEDFGPYHRIQCTTNDPGSKSFTDGTGKFSTQGTTTFLVGAHLPRKFSHYEVL